MAMTILLHSTTQRRAKLIEKRGPDPDFVEPNGMDKAESFSANLVFGPFEAVGRPEDYACRKAARFPDDGGPAMLVVDVPDDVIALAVDESFPLSQGFVQFDKGAGLEELRAAWPTLQKRLMSIECP